jgi:methyl-accepting chemotaxis protein
MSQLDQATQQNAALAEQSAAAVESMRSESTALVSAVGQFKLA